MYQEVSYTFSNDSSLESVLLSLVGFIMVSQTLLSHTCFFNVVITNLIPIILHQWSDTLCWVRKMINYIFKNKLVFIFRHTSLYIFPSYSYISLNIILINYMYLSRHVHLGYTVPSCQIINITCMSHHPCSQFTPVCLYALIRAYVNSSSFSVIEIIWLCVRAPFKFPNLMLCYHTYSCVRTCIVQVSTTVTDYQIKYYLTKGSC